MRKCVSEKHQSSGLPAEGFKGLGATDGSLLEKDGKRRACGWAVVQTDCDEEMEPLHGMYGSMGAELTAFLCFVGKVSGPIMVHVDNKGTIGETECWRCRLVVKNLGRLT